MNETIKTPTSEFLSSPLVQEVLGKLSAEFAEVLARIPTDQRKALIDHLAEESLARVEDLIEREQVGIPLAIAVAKKAFLRDLPELLKNPKYARWSVAYARGERIALAASEAEVIRECVKRRIPDNECYIGTVAPYEEDEEIDKSLYEFDDIE